MKKNWLKILLDVVLLGLLLLMYQKQVISMSFHEIGGLALLGLFLVHLLINRRWIASVTRRLFSKKIPARTRIGYLIDVLLVAAFALVGVSGILISKQLFSFHGGYAWKTIHYTAAAAALILMGVHLALHWRFVLHTMKKIVPIPAKIAKPLGMVLAACIFLFGVYSMTSTSFLSWLAMPLGTQGAGFGRLEDAQTEGFARRGQSDLSASITAGTDSSAEGTDVSDSAQVTLTNSGIQGGEGGYGRGESESGSFDFVNLLVVIARYGSITGAVAVAVVLLEKLFGRKRKKAARLACQGT